jgi:hypothetical protein
MGERKCAYEGCNALEFRTSGYCLRHKDGNPQEKTPAISNIDAPVSTSIKNVFGFILMIFGYRVLQVEPITHWFEGLINPIVQICGMGSLLIGASLLLSPVFARFGFGSDNSSPAKPSFDPSTGMFYCPAEQDVSVESGSSEE